MGQPDSWLEKIIEDVNQEDGIIISFFGGITDFLYKIILFMGVPFVLYLLLNFKQIL